MANKRVNPYQQLFRQIPKPFRSRYFFVLLLFFSWMIFADRHDFWTQWKLQKSVQRLQQDKAYFTKKIKEVRQYQWDMEIHKEKYAREKYYLQKKNEDVFIIEKKKEE